MTPSKERNIRKLLTKKVGVVKIGKSFGIGTGTVQRIKSDMRRRISSD